MGEPSLKELVPDADLGKCVKPGSRNIVRRPQDADRAFGCPSVRTDIPMKQFKSVADHQNYGDEPEAIDILFPASNAEIGIQQSDFLQLKPKVEIRTLFERIGYSYKPGKFNALFNRSIVYTRENLLPGQHIA